MFQFVIGDRFASSADNQNYILYNKEQLSTSSNKAILLPGQGLSNEQRRKIEELYNSFSVSQAGNLIAKEEVHKGHHSNILISELLKIEEGKYHSNLVINNDNELLLDHFGGSHVPGMIFIEATRQLAMAAWSKLEGVKAEDQAMVINDIHSEYNEFVFLFECEIEVSIEKKDGKYLLSCDFIQNGKSLVHTYGSFKVMNKKLLHRIENSMLKKSTAQKLKELENSLSTLESA